jgi:hypothetical protein
VLTDRAMPPRKGEAGHDQEAAHVVCECRLALETGYAIVSAALANGESQVHAAGRIIQAFPWIASRNVDALCARAFLLAN